MKPADALLRFSAVAVSIALTLACVALTAANRTRTTPAGPGVVFRENVWTGTGEFCGLATGQAIAACVPVSEKPAPRFSGEPASK